MTNKEIADRIRATLTVHSDPELAKLADELDPPRPEPGTVVWWRGSVDDTWHLGCVVVYGIVPADNINACWNWGFKGLEWKPARIAGPMQEIVDVPPVSEWLVDAVDMTLSWNRRVRDGKVPVPIPYKTIITRDEAARREAEG